MDLDTSNGRGFKTNRKREREKAEDEEEIDRLKVKAKKRATIAINKGKGESQKKMGLKIEEEELEPKAVEEKVQSEGEIDVKNDDEGIDAEKITNLVERASTKTSDIDWEAGKPIGALVYYCNLFYSVPYAALCKTFEKIEATTKRLEIQEHLTTFFVQIIENNPDNLLETLYLCLNRICPEYENLELGVGESLLIKSIAETTGRKTSKVKEELAKWGDLGKVAKVPSYDIIVPILLKIGVKGLRENCKLTPGIPLKPMLAHPTKSITEALDRVEGQTFTCEFKYDGERGQIHMLEDGTAKIYSRNLEDSSMKYPDVLEILSSIVKSDTKSFVLDCEVVAWDPEKNCLLPFQILSTRKRKDVKESDIKGKFAFARYMNASNVEEIQAFLDESVKGSCEGLMVKILDGPESRYEPSKRSRNWLKEHEIPEPKTYYNYDKGAKPDVWFEPCQVWEVKTADLSISPIYKAALGKIREDKKPEDATSSDQVKSIQRHTDYCNKIT
ncbi:12675_t:CDS:10 [Racocetra fulgida]|uniref:12675_t:CDS:1 n=1 Tax=Racocetra fulgida TaxID=60492 RepID=A0A9N9A8Y9_9GLOM|nr:12675_t:CDS:10 [Racocetra fulgida]